jgi:Leucine-rich repeat (LRR) protein
LGGFTQYCYEQDENWNPGKKTYPDWLEKKVGQDYLYAIDAFLINSRPNADPAIEIAATLPALRLVKLPGCKITDNSIKPLAKLKRLEWLELFATPVTDDCMDTISRIRSLKTLDLRRTNVTDNSIDDIVNLPHLRNLYIGKSAISEEGVGRIRKRMPKCNVDTKM